MMSGRRSFLWAALIVVAGATWGACASAADVSYLSTISGEVVHANTIELPRLTFSDVVAFPVMRDRVLRLSDVRGQAYGGVITGVVTIDLRDVEHQRVDAHLTITNVDLALLLAAFSPTSTTVAGRVDGTVDLSIPLDQPERLTGHGDLAIRDGTLVELSWFSTLLMGKLSGIGQDRASAQFELGDGRWRISNMVVLFANAEVRMWGSIGFDGDMDMLVTPRFGSFLGHVPLLGRLFDSATGALSARVAHGALRGPIAKPEWIAKPFEE
jgi:hypothetical protein